METDTWWFIRTIDGAYAYFGAHAEATEQMMIHGRLCGYARLNPATPTEAAQAYDSVRRAVRLRSYEALRRGAGLPSTGEVWPGVARDRARGFCGPSGVRDGPGDRYSVRNVVG